MIIVSDTSPISNLLKIDEIELLRLTFSRVIIPNAVYIEICRIEENRVGLERLDWIERIHVNPTPLRNRLLQTVNVGEAEAIDLALQISADYLLIDEAKGRSVASELGIKVTGIIGILLRAKHSGHIALIEPYIRRLVTEARFRLSSELIRDALYQAGET